MLLLVVAGQGALPLWEEGCLVVHFVGFWICAQKIDLGLFFGAELF